MKMKMKMKNRSHRCDINRHKARNGNKYTNHKKCRKVMLLICINSLNAEVAEVYKANQLNGFYMRAFL